MEIKLPAHIERLANIFHEVKKDFYLVGGALRDQILNREHHEWDAATNAIPDEIIKILKQANAKQIGVIGKRFGTITAVINSEPVEITTYRAEQYEEGSRNPKVKFGDNINDDLSRRDFTINALAYDPLTKKLLDRHNGVEDLSLRKIRAVGDATERFREDPLRMLRAIRFSAQLNFDIDRKTFESITRTKDQFGVLSTERIQQEINKILLSEKPSKGIELLKDSGLIAYIIPELLPSIDIEFDPREHKDIYHHIIQVMDNTPPKLELRWCAILHDIAKPLTRRKVGGEYSFIGHENVGAKIAREVLTRLKYPNSFIKYVSKLVRLHQRIPNDDGMWTDGAVRRFVRDAAERLDDLFIFAEADSTGKNERKNSNYRKKREVLKKRIADLEKQAEIAKLKSPLSGEDLMKIFHRPAGKWIKPIKDELLKQVIDGELQEKDTEKAIKIAKSMITLDTK